MPAEGVHPPGDQLPCEADQLPGDQTIGEEPLFAADDACAEDSESMSVCIRLPLSMMSFYHSLDRSA